MSSKYIVITPAKNEEKFIGNSIQSVVDQSIRPLYYLIVNDGSVDDTQNIIDQFSQRYSWINSIILPHSEWDIGVHYSHVCISGFDYAIRHCGDHNIDYDYILLLDSDTVLEKDYVKKLLQNFFESETLGIVSGGVYHEEKGVLTLAITRLDHPRGCCRMWRLKCFTESGGYVCEPCPDSISNIKARHRGWILKQIPEAVAIEQRETSSGMGVWRGAVKNGYFAYRCYKNPLIVGAWFVDLVIKKKMKNAIGYLYGYFSSFLRRKEITSDPEIKRYYMVENLGIVFRGIFK